MIPTGRQIEELWDTCGLPERKRHHSKLVAKVAVFFAERLLHASPPVQVNIPLLAAAALLHDVDKMAPKLPGEHHPDTGVRILREHGFSPVADLVRTHPVHAILDQSIAPGTREQELLYLADKMVKDTIITVDERFDLWKRENLPEEAQRMLASAYPLAKALEKKVCDEIGIVPEDLARLANAMETSTMDVLNH
jgi:putative nucleotidyltransferase with HDIG domain